MKLLKIFLFVALLMGISQQAVAQGTVNFSTSNLNDWVAVDANGNVGPVVPVGICNDPCIIQCICGNYPLPQEVNCGNGPAAAIWGTGPIDGGCSYAPGTFTFRTNVNIPDCNIPVHIRWEVIADNRFTLRVNGTNVTGIGTTDWETRYVIHDDFVERFEYNSNNNQLADLQLGTNIVNLLQPGDNTIEFVVTNLGGGSCLNYGFLSMCGSITIVPNLPDPTFFSNIQQNGIDVNSVNTSGPGISYQWQFAQGTTLGGINQPVPGLLGILTQNTFPHLFATPIQNNVFYRVVMRVETADGCAACSERIHFTGFGGKPRPTGNVKSFFPSVPVPCGNFRWNLRKSARAVKEQPSGLVDDVTISPNPVSNVVFVKAVEPISQIDIQSIDGKGTLTKSFEDQSKDASVEVTKLTPGVYFIHTTLSSGKSAVQKIIVE